MNKKQIELLYKLYLGEKYSLQEMANEFLVSDRTIRNYISDLNSSLTTNVGEIKRNPDKQFQLFIYDEEMFLNKFKKYFEIDSFDFSYSHNRIIYMSLRFLLAEDYIKLDDFIEELYVSKTAINNDFLTVRKFLNNYNLKEKSKPKYGIKFIGTEKDIRKALSYFTKQTNEISEDLANKQIFKISDKDYSSVKSIIKNVLINNNESVSNISFNNILHHILIIMDRSNYSEDLVFTISDKLNNSFEYSLSSEILNKISEMFKLNISDKEKKYLASHLLGLNLKRGTKIDAFVDFNLSDIVDEIISNIQKSLKLEEVKDSKLKESIISHLGPALYRSKNNIILSNPLLKHIKTSFPLAFQLAIESTNIIYKRTGIKLSEDEIAYIAIHIGTYIERISNKLDKVRCLIVCTTGLATSKLVKQKILNMFSSKISIVDSIELYEIEQFPEDEYDLIISTIPLDLSINKPYVYIENILNESEYIKIIDFLENRNDKIYLERDNIHLNLDFNNKEDLIEYISEDLIKKGLVSDKFYESVMNREKISSSYVGNSIAIPHPLEKVSKKTFWVLTTLKNSIDWDGKQTKLVIFLIINKDEKYTIDSMYNKLLKIIENPNIINEILSKNQSEKIYKLVQEI